MCESLSVFWVVLHNAHVYTVASFSVSKEQSSLVRGWHQCHNLPCSCLFYSDYWFPFILHVGHVFFKRLVNFYFFIFASCILEIYTYMHVLCNFVLTYLHYIHDVVVKRPTDTMGRAYNTVGFFNCSFDMFVMQKNLMFFFMGNSRLKIRYSIFFSVAWLLFNFFSFFKAFLFCFYFCIVQTNFLTVTRTGVSLYQNEEL